MGEFIPPADGKVTVKANENSFVPPTDSVEIKKKAPSNWGSDSQPKDTATSLVSGDWTKSTIPSEKPIEKAKINLKPAPVKEDTSFFDYLKENLDTGLATVSKSLYDAPGLVYDAAASITNPIIKGLTGYDGEGASSDKLANDLGFKNIPSDILKEKIKVSNEKINAYSAKNGGDALQAVQDGNYVNAAKLVAGTTMQSLPIMVAAMASGGQTSALVAIGASTASTKNAQLKEENPEMGLGTRVLNATNAGIIEAVTGHLFTGASGAVMKKILADKGVEAGSKIIGKSFRSTVEKAIEKNPLIGAFGEVIEESAVEFGNQLNDMSSGIRTEFDVHAIKNAGLSATGMGGIQTLGVYGAKGYVKAKSYAKLKSNNKEVFKLRSEIENGNLSPENKAVLGLRADRLEAENKKLLGTEIEKAKALPTEAKTELNALNNEYEDLKTKFDDIDDAEDIPANLKPAMKEEIRLQASKNQKRKTEILSQNDGLEVKDDFSKFEGVEPDFDLENGKISSLPLKEQDRLNKLAVEQITGGDKTIEYSKEQVSQTANEIYKNEQTPTTSEAQPQAEVPQQAEAEKVAEVSTVEDVVATSVENIQNNGLKISGVTSIEFEDNNETILYGTKNNRTRISIKGMSKEQIQEEYDFDKQVFDKNKNRDFEAEEIEIKKSIGLTDNEKISALKELKSSKRYNDILENITLPFYETKLNEKPQEGDITPNASIRPTATNVGESGNSKQESPVQESVSSSVDGGEVKGDVEVVKKVKSVKGATYDVHFDGDGNVSKIISPKNGREIIKFTEREVNDTDAKGRKQHNKDGSVKKKKVLVSNPNYAQIEADALGLSTANKAKADKKVDFKTAVENIPENDPYSVALKALVNGEKVSFESIVKETGNKDGKWATNQSDKSLPSIEKLSEQLWEKNPDLYQQEIRNAIIDIISSHSNINSVKESVIEIYNENAKKQQDQELNAFLGNLSEKDMAMYEAVTAEDSYISELSDKEVEEYYNQKLNEYEQATETLDEKPNPSTQSDEKQAGAKEKPTTKERIAERIKLSDAKVDDWKNAVNGIDSIFGIKIKVDDIEGLNKNGIDIVEVIANIAKQAIAAGIHIDEAISKTIEHLKKTIDFDVNIDEIKERINPKKEAEKETTSDSDMEDFRDSWNLDPSSDEINQYDSGRTIAREHSETRNNQDYEVQKDFARVQIGIRAIEHAKRLFGAEYVEKTLSFIEQANLSPEKKAVAYVLLENEMDARVKEFPKNVGVQKLQDLVRAKSQEFLANSARAMGAGRFRVERFRELAKNGFSEEEFTNAILTTKQKNDKGKIQKLIQVSPDDINNESEYQESDEDFVIEEPTVKRNKEAVKKDISNVLAQMRKDLLKVAKGNVAMSSIPYAAQLQAVAPHIIKLSKLLAELGGMTTRQIVNEVYNDIKEVFPGINKTDVSDILKEHSVKKAKPKTELQVKQDSVKEIVKKALIEKGFGREITVTKNERDASGKLVKDADGRNVKTKEKRTVLDWKKLAGEAGTIANIRKNVEESLKGSKYSKAEINEMKKALEREYVRLTSDVIEKGLNELQNRNADRKPVNTKSAAKKLAELYNYGLFEKNKDSYEKIINSVLGFNGLDQMAFDEMKEIARGYAVLMDSGLSDTEIKSAVNSLSRRQSRLVATLAFSQADWKFKLAVALSEITNLSTRFKLVNLGNLAENISSGMMARAANNMMDAMANIASGKKTSNKAIKAQSKINARAKLRGITLEAAESYGDTSSLLLNHSAVEDYFNNATTNKVYHAIISTYMAKPVLEGADSYNKILITEAKMVRATIKVLEAKGMSNSDALDYVAKAITGESMKEALVKAKALIEKVNEDAGRKLLNDSESSIKSLAADIVKESLVSGGQLSETELKAIYTAAYKSAGKDIGHVSNNWVTDQISAKGAQVEKQVADAIKEKKWSVASGAVVNQIIWKNFISTFVGGGTNWFVKGLQKSANPLSLISLRDDIMKLKMAGKLDVTTDEGIKNMEESLYRGMNLRSTSATMLMGAIITASIIGGMSASGADDEIEKWLKENKWAKKYFDKTVPDAVVLMLAIKDKDFGRYIAKMVNVKADFFDDQKNTYKILEKYAKGYTEDDAVKISEASGDLGAMLGKRFEFPGPVRAAKDVKQIYKGLVKGEYDKTNYYTSGFMNGFFQGGIVEGFGLRKDPDFDDQNTPEGKFIEKQEKIKEYNALPKSEQRKIDANNSIPRLRGEITELENMKIAIKNNTPYLRKGGSPRNLSNYTPERIDKYIAKINVEIENTKKEAGDRYTEPND